MGGGSDRGAAAGSARGGVAGDELAALWRRWRDERSADARNRLVVAHAPLVKFVIGRMKLGSCPVADPEDLVSFGILGLLQAVERFDPDCGFSFTTFAFPRIRGAVIDELRRLDWVPRSVREQQRRDDLEPEPAPSGGSRDGATPTRVAPRAGPHVVSPVADLTDVWSDSRRADEASDDEATRGVENRMLVEQLLATLDAHDRRLVRAYYFEGRSLADIGRELGVTESRVSQIIGAIRRRLGETARASLDVV